MLVLKPIWDEKFSGRILVDLVSVRNGGGRDRCTLFRREALVLTACGKRWQLADAVEKLQAARQAKNEPSRQRRNIKNSGSVSVEEHSRTRKMGHFPRCFRSAEFFNRIGRKRASRVVTTEG